MIQKISLALVFSIIASFSFSQNKIQKIYDFKVKSIDGTMFDFATLKGKKIIIVNTASECGNTPQYKELEEMYKKYKSKNLVIVGFPANNFGAQEPGSDKEIKEFCTKNYAVTFPMMSKISVSGKDIAPLYKWLTQKNENGVLDAPVTWNFQKFLIDEKGNLVKSVAPKIAPLTSKEINEFVAK
jgi:glutathione peroxidase